MKLVTYSCTDLCLLFLEWIWGSPASKNLVQICALEESLNLHNSYWSFYWWFTGEIYYNWWIVLDYSRYLEVEQTKLTEWFIWAIIREYFHLYLFKGFNLFRISETGTEPWGEKSREAVTLDIYVLNMELSTILLLYRIYK